MRLEGRKREGLKGTFKTSKTKVADVEQWQTTGRTEGLDTDVMYDEIRANERGQPRSEQVGRYVLLGRQTDRPHSASVASVLQLDVTEALKPWCKTRNWSL